MTDYSLPVLDMENFSWSGKKKQISTVIGGEPLPEFQWYKIQMPSHAGFSSQPELDRPTAIYFSIPEGANSAQVTWVPQGNVNLKVIDVTVSGNLLCIHVAWWCGQFELCIGFM